MAILFGLPASIWLVGCSTATGGSYPLDTVYHQASPDSPPRTNLFIVEDDDRRSDYRYQTGRLNGDRHFTEVAGGLSSRTLSVYPKQGTELGSLTPRLDSITFRADTATLLVQYLQNSAVGSLFHGIRLAPDPPLGNFFGLVGQPHSLRSSPANASPGDDSCRGRGKFLDPVIQHFPDQTYLLLTLDLKSECKGQIHSARWLIREPVVALVVEVKQPLSLILPALRQAEERLWIALRDAYHPIQ